MPKGNRGHPLFIGKCRKARENSTKRDRERIARNFFSIFANCGQKHIVNKDKETRR